MLGCVTLREWLTLFLCRETVISGKRIFTFADSRFTFTIADSQLKSNFACNPGAGPGSATAPPTSAHKSWVSWGARAIPRPFRVSGFI